MNVLLIGLLLFSLFTLLFFICDLSLNEIKLFSIKVLFAVEIELFSLSLKDKLYLL